MGSTARAGAYTDDLSKCLVTATSPKDQTELIVWVFAAIGRHPAIKSYTKFTPEESAATSKRAAELFQRLLTEDCRKETIAAIKYEGGASMEKAFEVLGQVAMRGLMSDAEVGKGFASMTTYVDQPKIEALAKDAGVLPAEKPR